MLELRHTYRKYSKNMKKIDFKDKNTLIRLAGFVVVVVAAVLIYKGLQNEALKINNANSRYVDIANNEDYAKYEGTVVSGEKALDFSFLYKKDFSVAQGTESKSKWFQLYNEDGENFVTLYFTFEGKEGRSADDYISKHIVGNSDIEVESIKFAGDQEETVKYVLATEENTEYYLEEIKREDGDNWLIIVENKKADEEIYQVSAKDLIRSFEVVLDEVEEENEADVELEDNSQIILEVIDTEENSVPEGYNDIEDLQEVSDEGEVEEVA